VARGRLVRLTRRLALDRNPLRRPIDRVETLIMIALLALFLAAVPLSWLGVGRWMHQAGLREQQAQQSWHQVPALVIKGQREAPELFRLPLNAGATVLARWPGPGGRQQTGRITVAAPGVLTGARVPVWIDGSGQVTGPPLAASQLARRVIGAQALAQLVLVAALLSLAGLARWQLNRRRLARWEAEWATIGPRWSRHR
jgi:hypothetical protein